VSTEAAAPFSTYHDGRGLAEDDEQLTDVQVLNSFRHPLQQLASNFRSTNGTDSGWLLKVRWFSILKRAGA
jgi:hypothetical protein